ncbi:MAG: Transcription-repair-coupling factor [bacterium]|nr:Transcription-repair-coupling factor [bacterium]
MPLPKALSQWFDLLVRADAVGEILGHLERDRAVCVAGWQGAWPMALVAAWVSHTPRPLLIIADDRKGANLWVKNLHALLGGQAAGVPVEQGIFLFDEQEPFVPDFFSTQELEGLISRYQTLEKLLYTPAAIVVTTPAALRLPLVSAQRFRQYSLHLQPGMTIAPRLLRDQLEKMGYRHTSIVHEPGECSVRGGILDIFPVGAEEPVRLDFFGDDLESLRVFDPIGQLSREELPSIIISPLFEARVRSSEELFDASDLHPGDLQDLDPDATDSSSAAVDQLTSTYFAQLDRASLADYLPPTTLVISEVADLADAIEALRQEVHPPTASLVESDLMPQALSEGSTTPGWELPFLPPEQIVQELEAFRTCCFLSPVDAPPARMPLITLRQQVVERPSGSMHDRLQQLMKQVEPYRTIALSQAAHRLDAEFGFDAAQILHHQTDALGGFLDPDSQLALLTDEEFFPQKLHPLTRRRRKRLTQKDLEQIHPGDYIVHVNYGIGVFRGIEQTAREGVVRDFIKLEYADGDVIRVPIDHLELVYKYSGGEGNAPSVHRLGSQEWAQSKARIKKSLRKIAEDLLRLYRIRATRPGYQYPPDTPWQAEVEDDFEFQETDGQIRALTEIKKDMESPKPMDRLICGEVGYGKTEVAVRAALKALLDGKQVAVLTPTTVLAQQHYLTFSRRFKKMPIRIEMLSRFRSTKEIKKALEGLKEGTVDLVIGTHRLLSKDVAFSNLGLLIIDEEQKFGVSHKERIKTLKETVDVLALSATPIPRTLYMSLIGLRDISVIDTPPPGRLPIRTIIKKYEDHVVAESIQRELDRGGQVYYLYNRVESIFQVAERLRKLVPAARIGVGHGQMDGTQLEEVMLDFLSGSTNVLLCTTIIENGLDIPSANTLIVENAQNFGLAQLHQLRGRVGRSSEQAFAYFLYPPAGRLTPLGRQRLEALATFAHLGAGYEIARRDLELRGAGNILGAEQHGFVSQVGLEVYCRLVNETIAELEGEIEISDSPRVVDTSGPVMELPFSSRISEQYIPASQHRVDFYQRILPGIDHATANLLRRELTDRFGEPPVEVEHLLRLALLKPLYRSLDLAAIRFDSGRRRLEFRWDDHRLIRPFTVRMNLQVRGRPLTSEPWGWSLPSSSDPGQILEVLEAALTVLGQGSRVASADADAAYAVTIPDLE